MTSGYLSRQAVNELLAVKQGEIDFVMQQLSAQTEANRKLQEQLDQLKSQLA